MLFEDHNVRHVSPLLTKYVGLLVSETSYTSIFMGRGVRSYLTALECFMYLWWWLLIPPV